MADLHKTSQTQVKVYMYIQAASRQQLPAPVPPRERAREVSIIALFLDPLIHCFVITCMLHCWIHFSNSVKLCSCLGDAQQECVWSRQDLGMNGEVDELILEVSQMALCLDLLVISFSCVSSCQLTPLRRGCWWLVGHNQHRRGQTLWSTVEWHV